MAADPLAAFRRGPPPKRDEGAAKPAYRAYEAAEGARLPVRFTIKPASGLAVARAYSALTEVHYDQQGTGFILVIKPRSYQIKGRNLQAVAEALIAGSCVYFAQIREGEAASAGEPVIETISFLPEKKEG
jgi:hypothetical protein